MRKLLWLLPVVLLGIGLSVYLVTNNLAADSSAAPALADLGITMLPATVAVDADLQAAVARALAAQAPERAVWVYAITDVSSTTEGWIVSVAGMPPDAKTMNLEYSIWLATVSIKNIDGMPGFVTEQMPFIANSVPSALGSEEALAEYGGSANILPFKSGTTATYGTLGIHDCGYSLSGWRAVDLFPQEENMIYASSAGNATYVCRDENQVSMRIGNNLYAHVVDSGQEVGDSYTQGQAIGALVPGTYDSACGYASQSAGNYHVHFCFVSGYPSAFEADGYILGYDSIWRKGGETVEPLGTLTASWEDAGVTPPGGLGIGNFWDSMIGGIISMANHSMEAMPIHQDMGMVKVVGDNVSPALELINLLFFSNFDMTVPLWVISIVFVMENVRIIYATCMLIKRAIPIIG